MLQNTRRARIGLAGMGVILCLIWSARIDSARSAPGGQGGGQNQGQTQGQGQGNSSQQQASQPSSSLNPSLAGQSFDFSRPNLRQQWRSHPPNLEKAARFVCYDVKEDVANSYLSDPTHRVNDPVTGKLYPPDVPLYAVPSNKIFTDRGHVIECLDRKAAYRSPLKMGDRLVIALNISNDLLPRLTRIAINVQSQSVAPIIINPLRSELDAGSAPNAEEQGSFDTNSYTHDPNSLAELEARIAQAKKEMKEINENIKNLHPLNDEVTDLQNQVNVIKQDAGTLTNNNAAERNRFNEQTEELSKALAGMEPSSAAAAAESRYNTLINRLNALQQSYEKQEAEAKAMQQQAYDRGDQAGVEREADAIENYARQTAAVNKPLGIASELIPGKSQHYYFELGNRLSGDTIPTLTRMAEYYQPDIPVTDANHQIQCIDTKMTPAAPPGNPTAPYPPEATVSSASAPPSTNSPMPYQTTVVPCLPYSNGGTSPRVYNSNEALPNGQYPVTYSQVTAVGVVQDMLPQVHSLSSFNVDAGVVYNTTKNKSFGFNQMGNPITTTETSIIDPVLFLTWYPRAIDAESPTNCYKGDFGQCIHELGLTLGLSMASPTSNFYFGPSLEPFRGVQLVGGLSITKVPMLAPPTTAGFTCTPPCTGGTPPTVQNFKPGGYVGVSFDIKAFIQSIGSAAFSSSSAGGSATPSASSSGKGG
jgi:hypothetical protein